MTTKRISFAGQKKFSEGVRVITSPDIRWARCDIKTVGLLPNCLGKSQAYAAGANEAWQGRPDGHAPEGAVSKAWIVKADDRLLKQPASHALLTGFPRLIVLLKPLRGD